MCKRMNPSIWLAVLVLVIALGTGAIAAEQIIYVDDSATGARNGRSWQNAFVNLQDGLIAALLSSIRPIEIRVAQGTYRPDQGIGVTPGDREATFQLSNFLTLKGGYAGVGEPDPNTRDIDLYETILSGDLLGNDAQVADPCDLLDEPARGENSYHVVTAYSTSETAVLDGFTITAGNADADAPSWNGGGMFNFRSSPTLNRCIFTGNSAGSSGGGMYNIDNSSPTLTDCNFIGNAATWAGGGMKNDKYSSPTLRNCTLSENAAYSGGGMQNAFHSRPTLSSSTFSRNSAQHGGGGMLNVGFCGPTLTGCTFSRNSAGYGGGGMYTSQSSSTLTDCTFSGNSAGSSGGGMHTVQSTPTLTKCIFSGNYAENGGGMFNDEHGSPTVTNCTFAQNLAQNGNAMACDSQRGRFPGNVELINCILSDCGSEIWNNNASTIDIANSNVQYGQVGVYDPCEAIVWGEGNIDADPCFANPGHWADANDPNIVVQPYFYNPVWVDGDYHLKSQAGRRDPNSQSWIQDEVTSPCIDAGDPNSPIGDEAFPNGGIVNMGAYGGTAEASKSYFGEPVCETIVAGDINGDCKVDFLDFGLIALHWLENRSGS